MDLDSEEGGEWPFLMLPCGHVVGSGCLSRGLDGKHPRCLVYGKGILYGGDGAGVSARRQSETEDRDAAGRRKRRAEMEEDEVLESPLSSAPGSPIWPQEADFLDVTKMLED